MTFRYYITPEYGSGDNTSSWDWQCLGCEEGHATFLTFREAEAVAEKHLVNKHSEKKARFWDRVLVWWRSM